MPPAEPESGTPARCPNCGAPAGSPFCPECGQPRHDRFHVPLRHLLGEVVEETVGADSRFARTLGPLLARPGAVSAEVLAGRRARYTSALRLYLVASFAYFGLSAVLPGTGPGGQGGISVQVGRADGSVVQVASARPEDLASAEAELRRDGGRLSTALADRLHAMRALPPGEAARRLQADLLQALPRVAFVLVPVFAALLGLAFAGQGRFYAEHLVVALHQHAVGFLLLVPSVLAHSQAVTLASAAAIGLHTALALRRVYGRSWPGTVWRCVLVGLGYLLSLGIGMAGAAILALAFFPAGP
jgi:Protein of unknown function (DUF3667)